MEIQQTLVSYLFISNYASFTTSFLHMCLRLVNFLSYFHECLCILFELMMIFTSFFAYSSKCLSTANFWLQDYFLRLRDQKYDDDFFSGNGTTSITNTICKQIIIKSNIIENKLFMYFDTFNRIKIRPTCLSSSKSFYLIASFIN